MKPVFTRSFVFYRLAFYLAVAFFVRESSYVQKSVQSRLLSSEFITWSATFPSRLDRAMESEVAE
jgi:hypothetical protein